MEFISNSFSIKKVYGTATNQTNPNTLLEVNTLFPSSNDKDWVKGGVILISLNKNGYENDIKLKVSYYDREGIKHQSIKDVKFDSGNYYDGSAVQKAIILSDYVNIIKNWIIDTRKGCNDKVEYPSFEILRKRCVYPPLPPKNFSTWERKSCKLEISRGYKKLFYIFLKEFQKQKYLLRDSSLKKEENALKLLLEYADKKNEKDNGKKDDWRFWFFFVISFVNKKL